MINTLRKLFSQILSEENEDFDLRDRTIFYCKALQTNTEGLKKVTEENANFGEMFVEEIETYNVFIPPFMFSYISPIGRRNSWIQHTFGHFQKAC